MTKKQKLMDIKEMMTQIWKDAGYSCKVENWTDAVTTIKFYAFNDEFSLAFMRNMSEMGGQYGVVGLEENRVVYRIFLMDDEQ